MIIREHDLALILSHTKSAFAIFKINSKLNEGNNKQQQQMHRKKIGRKGKQKGGGRMWESEKGDRVGGRGKEDRERGKEEERATAKQEYSKGWSTALWV